MGPRIASLNLAVTDLTKALDFYTKKIGFEIRTSIIPAGSNRYAKVGLTGQDVELALWEGQAPNPNWKPGAGMPIVLAVDDCRRTFAEFKSRGVTFMQAEPDEKPWGIYANFSDPDGNAFTISQFPA